MRSRIKYMETKKEGILKSAVIPAKNGACYRVVLDLNTMTFKIVNVKNNGIVRSTEKCGLKPSKNRLCLVRQARRQAVKFGLLLEKEIQI